MSLTAKQSNGGSGDWILLLLGLVLLVLALSGGLDKHFADLLSWLRTSGGKNGGNGQGGGGSGSGLPNWAKIAIPGGALIGIDALRRALRQDPSGAGNTPADQTPPAADTPPAPGPQPRPNGDTTPRLELPKAPPSIFQPGWTWRDLFPGLFGGEGGGEAPVEVPVG